VDNLLIRAACILIVTLWPVEAGLTGFAIAAIGDYAGNAWAFVATLCLTTATLATALLIDLAETVSKDA
jgi:hypothetical protein